MPKLVCQKDTFEFDEECCPILVGAGMNCNVRLPHREYIAEEHLEFTASAEGFFVRNLSRVPVGTNSGGILLGGAKKALKTANFFCFGTMGSGQEIVLAYENLDRTAKVKLENLEIQKPLKNEQEIIIAKFYEGINVDAIEKYLCSFIAMNFAVSTVIVIVKDAGRWISIARQTSADTSYTPSMTLLKQFAASLRPVKFDLTETNKNPSLSILQNKIRQAYLLPLSTGQQCFGALYFDTQGQGTLNERDFYKIGYLLENGVSALIRSRQSQNKINYPIRDSLPKSPFSVRLSKSEKNMVFVARQVRNSFIFLIVMAENSHQAALVRAFSDGVNAGQDAEEPVYICELLEGKFPGARAAEVVVTYGNELSIILHKTGEIWTGTNGSGEMNEQMAGSFKLKPGQKMVARQDAKTQHDILEIML